MLRRQHVAFRVGHEAQDVAAHIAQAGHIILRAVWIDRIGTGFAVAIDIAENDLAGLVQSLENPGLAADEVAFAVSDRQFQGGAVLQEDAFSGAGLEIDPAVLEFAGFVVGQCGERAVVIGGQDQAGFEEGLEAVADAEDKFFPGPELPQLLAQEVPQLIAQNFSGGHIVAVGEAAGNDQDLKIVQQLGLLPEPLDVQPLRDGAGLFEGKLGFDVAVGAGGTEDQSTRGRHGVFR